MKSIIVLFCLIPVITFSQKLTEKRVNKLLNAVVSIEIEGLGHSGTGFFISEKGDVITCFHVIEPAFIRDVIDKSKVVSVRNIYIKTLNGDRFNMLTPMRFLQDWMVTAAAFDFITLYPNQKNPIISKYYYDFGNFDKTHEGTDIYTAGFPFGMEKPFISKGILSLKITDTLIMADTKKTVYRKLAFLDITTNKGTSGSPIISFGNTEAEDKVIGIYGFNIGKFNDLAMLERKKLETPVTDTVFKHVSIIHILKILTEAESIAPYGMGGCVSIDGYKQFLNTYRIAK